MLFLVIRHLQAIKQPIQVVNLAFLKWISWAVSFLFSYLTFFYSHLHCKFRLYTDYVNITGIIAVNKE
jgi:hypothetical protein